MDERKIYCSRSYWSNYIDSIIDSIKQDEDSIIDLIMYGKCGNVKIIMNFSKDEAPNYDIVVNKMGQKSPFGDDDDK